MHRYRAKEYLWVLIVLMMVLVGVLSGCSSAPKAVAEKPQYCYTSQTIQTQNGEKVSSNTTVECTDDQVKRLFQVRSGMAPNCGEFTYWMKLGGHDVQRKGISCQKPDGSWEIVNTGS
jgi:uncharacterized protein YceK